MTNRFNPLIAFLLLACVAVNLHSLIGWNNTIIGNDGIQYLTTAKNWLAGLGFSTDALMYAPHFQGVIPAPQTVWPTGYPAAIALFSLTGLELKTAALLLNLITHVLASVLIGFILLRGGLNRRTAFFCALMFYLMAKPWLYAISIATEPVFVTLILAATLALPSTKASGLTRWILCGVLICLCIFIRYSAVFFAFGVGTGIFAYLLIYEPKPSSRFLITFSKLTLLTIIPVLGFAYLMLRTRLLIGTLERYGGTKQAETFISTAKLWSAQASELMGFNAGGIFKHGGSASVFVIYIGLILVLTSLFFYRKLHIKNQMVSAQSMDFFRLSTLVMVAHSVTMIGYLTYSSMSETPLEIVNRYLYQIYPSMYIAFCIMVNALVQNSAAENSNKPSKKLAIPICAIIVIYMLTQANELLSARKPYLADSIVINELLDLPTANNITVSSYMERCVKDMQPTGSIWSTHGQYIHLKNGLATITHDKIYTNQPFDAASLEQAIKDYNIKMFVFLEFKNRFSTQYIEHMAEIKKWLISNQYAQAPLLENRSDANHSIEILTKTPKCGL